MCPVPPRTCAKGRVACSLLARRDPSPHPSLMDDVSKSLFRLLLKTKPTRNQNQKPKPKPRSTASFLASYMQAPPSSMPHTPVHLSALCSRDNHLQRCRIIRSWLVITYPPLFLMSLYSPFILHPFMKGENKALNPKINPCQRPALLFFPPFPS